MTPRRRVRTPLPGLILLGLPLLFSGCDDAGPPAEVPCIPGPGVLCTFMGTGTPGLTPDGLPAKDTELYLPQDLTFAPDGRPFVLDWNNHRIRVVDAAGLTRTVIGTGRLGDAPAGVGTEINLNHPTHLAFHPSGDLIVAAWHNSKVLRYNFASLMVAPICGTGARSFNGDGKPGLETLLDLPVATAITADGRILISDQANQRVRALSPDNTVTTVVGTGMMGYTGDGGPAVLATINLPTSQSAQPAGRIALDNAGVLYLADTGNNVIRRIGLDGIISTIAGTGSAGTGAAGPALSAALFAPADVDADAAGNVYIADTWNNCVRRVTPQGTIATVAGVCGTPGDTGHAGPATTALLDRPYGIALDKTGNLFIADTHNHVIRVVYAPF